MPTPGTKRASWRRRLAAIVLAAAWLGGAALLWPEPVERIVHPARFATTGRAMLPPDAYLAAARARRPGARIGALILPRGGRAVIVMTESARLWLDPPTARVLDVDDERPAEDVPLAEPAQGVAAVIARARAVAPGRVARVTWPGAGRPDWLVTLTDHGHDTVLKVADDTDRAGAAVARAGRLDGGDAVAVARWAMVAVPVLLLAVVLTRRRR